MTVLLNGGLPEPTQLLGSWHITHTTFPMWRDKTNITVNYTAIPNSAQLDDLVSYDVGTPPKQKSIHGYDTPSTQQGLYTWVGAGWMRVAKSVWEIVGFKEGEWMVTYAQKSMFSPAGLIIYSKTTDGLSEETVEGIKKALANLENEEAKGLVASFYETKRV